MNDLEISVHHRMYWLPFILQAEMIHKLGEEMGTKLAKAEDLGAQGLVVESLQLMEEVENLKKQKASAEVSLILIYLYEVLCLIIYLRFTLL